MCKPSEEICEIQVLKVVLTRLPSDSSKHAWRIYLRVECVCLIGCELVPPNGAVGGGGCEVEPVLATVIDSVRTEIRRGSIPVPQKEVHLSDDDQDLSYDFNHSRIARAV